MYLVFNIGGTNTRVGISADGQTLDKSDSFATCANFDHQLTRLKQTTENMREGKKIRVICGGIAGLWYTTRAKIYKSPNLPEWEGLAIKKKIESEFGVRTLLGNDVEMEGLGEAAAGAGRRKQIVVYLGIGTGIGGVKIVDGKVCPRVYGFEPGHQIIDASGEVGYLESFAGGAAMKKMFGKEPWEIEDNQIWEREAQLISIGIHNAIMFWSPEIVILGGSLMQKIDLGLVKKLLSQQLKMLPKMPEIALGELGDKAGLYGALTLLKED